MVFEKRTGLRLKYPREACAKLHVGSYIFDVFDISTGGLKFKCDIQYKPEFNVLFDCEVHLLAGGSHRTIAQAIRRVGDLIAVTFVTLLPEKQLKADIKFVESRTISRKNRGP